jgi:hypothetical protein
MTGVLGSGPSGEGTELHLTATTDFDTQVTPLLTVNRPNLTVDAVETTNHGSNGTREFIAGLANPGALSATILYTPGSAVDTFLLAHLASRETRAFKIRVVETDGTYQEVTGNLFLTSYEPDDAPVDGRREATITAQVTGATAQADAA